MERGLCKAPLAALLLGIGLAGCSAASGSREQDLRGTVEVLETQVSAQATEAARQQGFMSYLATRMPPWQPTSPVELEPTPFVSGSVEIEQGRCCVAAGEPVSIQVQFEASSPVADIAQMRVRTGGREFSEAELSGSEWQPFRAEREFEYVAPLNWSGFYVPVQFRDSEGNLSPVYSDDISVEGEPAPPIEQVSTRGRVRPPPDGGD